MAKLNRSMLLPRLLSAFFLLIFGVGVAVAQNNPTADPPPQVALHLESVRALAVSVTTRPTAIFLTITNHSAEPDRLLSVSSPVCGRAELHTHLEENGVMKMRQVEGFDVPAHGVLSLYPGGAHIMCFEPKKTSSGENFSLTLSFEKSGMVETADGRILNMDEIDTVAPAAGDHSNHAMP